MMLPDAVLDDLLSLYLADEASSATRQLIEERAAADPAFARRLASARADQLPELPSPPLSTDAELRSLRQTRQFLFLRSLFVAWAVVFALLPLAFVVDARGFHWLIWGRYPGLVSAFWSVAAASAVAAAVMQRQVRSSGL